MIEDPATILGDTQSTPSPDPSFSVFRRESPDRPVFVHSTRPDRNWTPETLDPVDRHVGTSMSYRRRRRSPKVYGVQTGDSVKEGSRPYRNRTPGCIRPSLTPTPSSGNVRMSCLVVRQSVVDGLWDQRGGKEETVDLGSVGLGRGLKDG